MSVGNQDYARLNIVCGTNGTGKSTFVSDVADVTHFKNVLIYIEGIDQGGKPFKKIPLCTPPKKYRGGKACISADDIEFDAFIASVTASFRNGLLVIDEAGMYTHLIKDGDNFTPEFTKLNKQRRKYNIELYMIYHSASEVPVRLFKWVNNVILFHQTDMFNHKGAVIPRIDELNAAKKRIEKAYFAGNRYACERVQLS